MLTTDLNSFLDCTAVDRHLLVIHNITATGVRMTMTRAAVSRDYLSKDKDSDDVRVLMARTIVSTDCHFQDSERATTSLAFKKTKI